MNGNHIDITAKVDQWLQRRQLASHQSTPQSQFYKALDLKNNDNDYDGAFAIFLKLASDPVSPHPQSQYEVARLYFDGLGTPKNYQLAAEWFAKAADNGVEAAANALGYMLMRGQGEPKDPQKAMVCFMKVAHACGDACNNIGYMFQHGIGVERNFKTALHWFLVGVHQHSSAAAFDSMGYMCKHGLGIPQNHLIAINWFVQAARKGSVNAHNSLGCMFLDGYVVRGVFKKPDYEQAMWHFRKGAEKGSSAAFNNMGYMWLHGIGEEQNYAYAMQCFESAAQLNSANGHLNIGHMYRDGTGVEKNLVKALECYKAAAALGSDDAVSEIEKLFE